MKYFGTVHQAFLVSQLRFQLILSHQCLVYILHTGAFALVDEQVLVHVETTSCFCVRTDA